MTTDAGDLHTMMGRDVTGGDLGMESESGPLLLKEDQALEAGVTPEISLEAGDPLEGIPPELAKTIQAMAEQELIDHMLD